MEMKGRGSQLRRVQAPLMFALLSDGLEQGIMGTQTGFKVMPW